MAVVKENMPIYVDPLMAYAQLPHAEKYFPDGQLLCHLVTDGDLEELHAFAQRIGLRRGWFDAHSIPHYDLTSGKREEAVRAGAFELASTSDLLRLVRAAQRKAKQASV